MLEIDWDLGPIYEEPCALVLGGFDGLHLGHRTLLNAARKTGLPVLLTSMLGGKEGMLFTKDERSFLFEEAGVDSVLYLPFTEELKSTSAGDFLNELFAYFEVKEIFCGEDFRFGKDATGTPAFLKKWALSRPVTVLTLFEKDGEKISVSRIKEALAKGNLSAVNAYLGSDYLIQGVVEHGRRVGRTYGFPTLNLSVAPEKLLPQEGVYGGYAVTPKGRYPTIINIGARPTFGVAEKKVEAYLKGFSGDLYGKVVRIYPTKFLRHIQKFSSEEELKNQLQKDIACV